MLRQIKHFFDTISLYCRVFSCAPFLTPEFDAHPVSSALTRRNAYTLIEGFGQRPGNKPEQDNDEHRNQHLSGREHEYIINQGRAERPNSVFRRTVHVPAGCCASQQGSSGFDFNSGPGRDVDRHSKFLDGAPYPETAAKVYDYLDTMRGVDAFLKGMPGASLQGLIKGAHDVGAVKYNQVLITDKLMDSASLFLTANTSTMYVAPDFDLETTGPMVVEAPAGMLGAFNDAWFRYMQDIGPAGPDKGKGGKYLVLPPGYEGEVPDGYFVVQSRTYNVWVFMRASIAKGLDVASKNVEKNLRIYPLSQKDNPPKLELISGSGKSFNTIHANDYSFYEHLNEVIQKEPLEMLDAETRGLFASIGMEKGKPFAPDARMRRSSPMRSPSRMLPPVQLCGIRVQKGPWRV